MVLLLYVYLLFLCSFFFFFFFQAEDGIRDVAVTGVQTCALPILSIFILDRQTTSAALPDRRALWRDRKSTRLNSSHGYISYAVFCLKKKNPPPDAGCVVAGGRATRRQRRLDRSAGARLSAQAEIGGYADRHQRFFLNDAVSAEIYPLSLHDALPI